MTEPQDPAPTPSDGRPADNSDLEAYLRANWGRYTEGALRQAALAQGHSPEAVDAAMYAVRAQAAPPTSRRSGSSVRTILIAYGVTFAVLTAGMLLNTSYQGYLFGTGAGVVVLGIALLAGLGLSAVWLRSRRAFLIAAGVLLVLFGLSNAFGTSGTLAGLPANALLVGLGAACLIGGLAVRRTPSPAGAPPASASTALLLSVPLLLLLVIGGICVASGLPFSPGT